MGALHDPNPASDWTSSYQWQQLGTYSIINKKPWKGFKPERRHNVIRVFTRSKRHLTFYINFSATLAHFLSIFRGIPTFKRHSMLVLE